MVLPTFKFAPEETVLAMAFPLLSDKFISMEELAADELPNILASAINLFVVEAAVVNLFLAFTH
ncbi:hypothetical protein D3C87_2031670 [compost metagenome]